MYDVSLRKLTKEYIRYTSVLILGILILVFAIYSGINIKNIDNNTTNWVEVNKYEKNGEKYTFGRNKYEVKYHYKIKGNDYVCKKTYKTKYWKPDKSEKVYINDFNHPEKCIDYETLGLISMLNFALVYVGALFIGLSFVNYKPSKNKLNDAKYLLNNGVLVKNAPYYKNITSRALNGDPVVDIVIHVKQSSGEYIRFSQTNREVKFYAKGGTVDILYDPSNYENYYVAKEINRIGGNLDSDYYQSTKEELEKLRRYIFENNEELYYRNKKKMKSIAKRIGKAIKIIKKFRI